MVQKSYLSQQLEALLFVLGRPLSREELASMLHAPTEEILQTITLLQKELQEAGRGIVLVDDGTAVELRATGEATELIERVRKEEYSRDIGKAGLEALSAVIYRGPLSRSQIDFIRGVNSSQTLRTLAMRGLVRKIPNPADERSFLYETTTELLSQLGVSKVTELPEYQSVKEKLYKLEEEQRARIEERQHTPENVSEA